MEAGAVSIAELVRRAQLGNVAARGALVEEFQGVATSLAAGWLGDDASAGDIAQDAFVTAFEHLGELVDPQAFPAWFVRIVRSEALRHVRREARFSTSLEAGTGSNPDPANVVVAGDESQRLRAAVESLPEHERRVVALHYLAGLSYPQVAKLLGISVSAAKKRAFSARQRLRELLPSAVASLASERLPRRSSIPAAIAVFVAIRERNHALVRDLLARDPGLVGAVEAWSQDEAMELGLQNAEEATPLVRAVQTGDVELVRLILDAGADARQRCGCAGGESALWTATLYGEARIVGALLTAGADPNADAFAGATPLSVAAQRGHHEITRLLLAAGADPSVPDAGGRTAADWSVLRRSSSRKGSGTDVLVTGVRALDLFAPVARRSVQWWPAAWELGQFALLTEVVRSLEPSEFWQIGFATGAYDMESGRQWLKQFPLATQLRLTPGGLASAERRAHFDDTVRELSRSPRDKIVMILTAPGHHHDVTLAVAQLADDPRVLTTIVIEPATSQATGPLLRRHEGFDAQVSFDIWRALRGLWPAVDPLKTSATRYPSQRHRELADAARTLLARYQAIDPELVMLDPAAYTEPALAARSQEMHHYLTQPFHLWEHVTALPGESTPYDELIKTAAALLAI
jgi:RNA polymerase sigma factor (sigma-70 family)